MLFFASPHQISAGMVEIEKEDAKHLLVLRHTVGDEISIADGVGNIYRCELLSIRKDGATAGIISGGLAESEAGVKITLFQALPKADKMELIIQKAVELGVHAIVPVTTERTVVELGDRAAKKTERFRKIAESAAKQSRRAFIPGISEPVGFEAAVQKMRSYDAAYIAFEKEESRKITDVSKEAAGIAVLIGPEGGFTNDEVLLCDKNKILPVSLGKRILRTETAGFTAVIGILLARGEM